MIVYCVMNGNERADLDHVVFATTDKDEAEKFAIENDYVNFYDKPLIEKLDVETKEPCGYEL